MKKLFISFSVLFILLGVKVFAQDEIAEIQKEWGKNKKELVQQAMNLSTDDAAKFWPLYDRYEKERQKLGKDRMMLISEFAQHFETLSNAKADELVTKMFKNELALTNLQQRYYISIKAKLDALKAAKFLQVENYIGTSIRSAIQDELPFIGELDSMKKH